ncbi:MAG: type II secretion system F family protein, partial [Thermoguttaceae bacterium]|nr:type II secretion system F family protein [Thermoguttaceae bacterium]
LRQLSELLNNGVPVLAAFQVLSKQEQNPVLREVIEDIYGQIAEGTGIDSAFASHPTVFDDLTISIIRAGSEGAFLEDALKRTAGFMEQQAAMKGRVVSAMIYPATLLIVGVIVVTVLLIFFVPKFQPMFDSLIDSGGELPAATKALLAFKAFIGHYGLFLVGGIIALGIVAKIALKTPAGSRLMDRWKLKIPLLGPVVQSSCISRFCRVFGTLLENGVPILRALDISSHSTGNAVLAQAVEKSAEAVSAGDPLSKPLSDSGLFPPQVMAMISIAEESNNLESVLVNVSESIERELTKKLDVMVRLLEPMMLLLLASGVFFIIIALLMPTFRMTENL